MSDSDGKKLSSAWADRSGYSDIELYPNGNYKAFVPEIDTEWVVNGRPLKLKADVQVSFFPDGTLKKCVLCARAILEVSGVEVPVAADAPLEFHANGNARRLTLASPASRWFSWKKRRWKYRGTDYDLGTELELSDGGVVVGATKCKDGV